MGGGGERGGGVYVCTNVSHLHKNNTVSSLPVTGGNKRTGPVFVSATGEPQSAPIWERHCEELLPAHERIITK